MSWDNAQAYARWLAQKTDKRYRLLSEAEWEYAARSGTETSRYWVDSVTAACQYANVMDQSASRVYSKWTVPRCDDGAVYTSEVGRYRPNGFGLYDMIGNAWEWGW